ncbi:MAG: chorismate mutase [Cellulosilyticaceae bacterium]
MSEILKECRKEIDKIDEQLIQLFEKRMEVVSEVARYKAANGLEIFQKKREDEVIEKNLKRLTKPDLQIYTTQFFEKLMELSRIYQSEQIGNIEKPNKYNDIE